MHSGDPPFNFSNLGKLKDHIIKGKVHFPKDFEDATSKIINGLLQVNPDERLGTNMKF